MVKNLFEISKNAEMNRALVSVLSIVYQSTSPLVNTSHFILYLQASQMSAMCQLQYIT